jgi:hypothetical protein
VQLWLPKHTLPQLPQLFESVFVSTSHPSSGSLLQSALPRVVHFTVHLLL